MGQPRVFYSMAKDGLLPAWAAKIHPRFQTPHITTAITGGIVAVLAGFVPIHLLGELVSIGTLFAFVIVGTGIIILRSSNPNLNRPFKVPFSPFIPIATVVSAAYLMNSLPLDTWIRLIVWMSIGLVIYFAYSYSHSHLGFEEGGGGGDEVPSDFTPPIAALLAVLATILLTVWQTWGMAPIEIGVRMFAWIVTGGLVAMLMYGKQDRSAGRDAQTKTIGLGLSVLNLLIWGAITYWYFIHYAELHTK
jgi:amino acid transporter